MHSYIGLIRACGFKGIQRNCLSSLFWGSLEKRTISTCDNETGTVDEKPFVTKSEAISFVEDVLEIPDPIVSATGDPWGFLCNFHKKMKTSVPFTNLVYINKDRCDILSPEERKRLVFTKHGAGCFDVYPVVQAVLRYLGFETLLIASSLSTVRTQMSISHVGLFVKNVTYPGSLHLIEPGTRHPILQPVPLEFKRFSPEYQVGHYPIRFFKTEPGVITMGTPAVDDSNVGEKAVKFDDRVWESLITYRTEKIITSSDCQKVVETILSDRNAVPDMNGRLVIFGFSQGLPTSIVGKKFYQYQKYGKTGRLVKEKMKTDMEVIEIMQEHFPQYSCKQVEEALMFWNA